MKKKYHIYVIVNNNSIFEANTLIAINNLYNIELCEVKITYNYKNDFNSIREWINSILTECYTKPELYIESDFIFMHQDVFFDSDFLKKIDVMKNIVKDSSLGMYGFAGVDSEGVQHKFMVDSGKFCFTGNTIPKVVDSVDEFIFGIKFNLLYNSKILLAKIKGWHAYAAEFSIILNRMNFKTFIFPIFTYHNSIRANNKGVRETHNQLYNIYGHELNTLVGKISLKSKIELFANQLYSIYVNYIKWKYKSKLIEKIKSFLLDDLQIRYNKDRVLLSLLDKYSSVFVIYFCKGSCYISNLDLNILGKQIKFRIIKDIKLINKYKEDNVLVIGVDWHLDGFKYYEQAKINEKGRNK